MKRSFRTAMAKDEDVRTNHRGTPFACIQIFRDFALGEAKDKNFVFSPCSTQLAISLIANGAKGSTLHALLKFLESESRNNLKSHASKLISALTESNSKGPNQLSFLGGVWVDQSKNITPNFKIDAENIYRSKAEVADFKNEAEETINTVNQWAAESTNGLIESLLPENSIDERTRVVLANALYFKGIWSKPFEKELTIDYDFHLLGGNSVKVPFMSNYSDWLCIKTFDDHKVLKLGYKKSSISMYILLPHARDGLWALIQKVGSDPMFLEECTNPKMKVVDVGEFGIPKFRSSYDFEASDVLKAMGLGLCFSDDAEFDEMVVGGNVKVERVFHGSYVEVEEEGTRAAGTFAIQKGECCSSGLELPPQVVVDFVADHPFLYVVKDDANGMVLFMGIVVNPLLE